MKTKIIDIPIIQSTKAKEAKIELKGLLEMSNLLLKIKVKRF